MMIPIITSDSTGHSQFGDFDLVQKQRAGGGLVGTELQKVAYWQMSLSEPGDMIDYQTTDMTKVIAILSGQMEITVSNGEIIRLTRGDMIYTTDVTGQGHKVEFVGLEPCLSLHMAMPEAFKA